MFKLIILIVTTLLAFSNCRNIFFDQTRPFIIIKNGENILSEEIERSQPESVESDHYLRVRRQVQSSSNSDGTYDVNVKIPLVNDVKNKLNADGSISGASDKGGYKVAEGNLIWENVKGHGAKLSLKVQSIPDEGKKLIATGKAKFHNDNHDLTASAFASRTFPDKPNDANTDNFGGKLEYINAKGHSAILKGEHNPDIGSQLNAAAKTNLFHNENHDLTADAFIVSTFPKNKDFPNTNTFGGKLGYSNSYGHEASLMAKHIPNFGNELTAAGKATLFHNNKHDVTADAFATKTFSSNPFMPDFNKYGGNLEYTYGNKIGASLGMVHDDLFKKTDYSAMGNFNLFRDRTSSLDLNAGFSKSVSPFMQNNGWNPYGGVRYTKYF